MEQLLFLTQTFEPFTSSWGALCIPLQYDNGYILPLGWEQELAQRGIEFTEIEIEQTTELFIEKLYFSTPEERDAFNAAEAEYAGADPSIPYLQTGEDELGYYLLVDVIANPNLWQRFKNLFN